MTGPLPYDLQASLITVAEAAELASVTESVVRNWISRGYRDTDGGWARVPKHVVDGRTCVVPIDVLRAEAATRKRAGR